MSETLTLSRARELVEAICHRSFVSMGFADRPLASLEGVTLREMLDAVDMVKSHDDAAAHAGGPRVIHVIPDDRLVAAVYAVENYEPSRQAVLSLPGPKGRRMLAVLHMPADSLEAANG